MSCFFLLILVFARISHALLFGSIDPASLKAQREGDVLHVQAQTLDGKAVSEDIKLVKVPEGIRFYHWADEASARIYGQSGSISAQQMANLNLIHQTLQSYGPGFYVSADPFDSRAYGDLSVEIHSPSGGFYVIPQQNTEAFRFDNSENARQVFAKLQEQGVWGSKLNSYEWYVLNDARATTDVRPFDISAYVKENPLKPGIVEADAASAVERLAEGKPWTAGDVQALGNSWDKIPPDIRQCLGLELKKEGGKIIAAAGPGHPVSVVIPGLLLEDAGAFTRGDDFNDVFRAKFADFSAALKATREPASLQAVIPLVNRVLDANGYLQYSLPAADLVGLLEASKGDPDFLRQVLRLSRWSEPSIFPAGVSRWMPGGDFAFTRALAEATGVPADKALAFRRLLFESRFNSIDGKRAGKILGRLEMSGENALALIRVAGDIPELQAAALRMAGRVEHPGPEILQAMVKALKSPAYPVRAAVVEAFGLFHVEAPPLRGQVLSLLRDWYSANKPLDSFTRDFEQVLLPFGLKPEDFEGGDRVEKLIAGAGCENGYSALAK
jgi:hypothetical protein